MALVLALSVLPMLQSASFITSSFSVARFANSERKRRREGGKRKRRDRVHAQPATFCCNFSCVLFLFVFVVVVVYLVHRMAAGPRSCTVPGKSGQQLQEGESRVFIISGRASANGKRKGKEDG